MNESRKMMMDGVMAFAVALALTAAGATPEEALTLCVSTADELLAVPARLKSLSPGTSVEIRLAPGEYHLPRPLVLDAGMSGGEGTVRRFVGPLGPRRSVLTASRTIPRDRFCGRGRDGVWVADLRGLGVALPNADQVRRVTQNPPDMPEVFVDGRRCFPASWPGAGEWATFTNVVEVGAGWGDKEGPTGTFGYEGDRPARWRGETNMWLHGYFRWDWRDNLLAVGRIDTAARTITLGHRATYGLGIGNPSPRRWRAVHVRAELDEPGEFYIDFASQRLHLMPWRKGGEIPEVRILTRNGPLVRLDGARGVAFDDVDFEMAASAVESRSAVSCALSGARIRNIRNTAVSFNAANGCEVSRCGFEEIGGLCLEIGGGDRRTLAPSGNRVHDCVFGPAGVLARTGYAGVVTYGVGTVIEHNLIRDMPHHALGIDYRGGNDCVFADNVISNCCNESDDAGAFYKGRNPSSRGNLLLRNLFVDCGTNGRHGTCAAYFDDSDCGDLIVSNVFERCGGCLNPPWSFGAVFTGGGYQFRAHGNVFVDCRMAFGSCHHSTDANGNWPRVLASDDFRRKLLEEVDIRSAVWRRHYPELERFLPGEPEAVRTNVARDCTLIRVGRPTCGNWRLDESCKVLGRDDGMRPFHPSEAGPRPLSAGATPEEAFAAPPPEAHVGVWWHWMGGQVSREGVEKDLDWFVRMGITSATVFGMADCTMPWARRIGNVPTGIHPYDETWWGVFKFACAEGKRRGIDIGIHICPGYTSTGGPWVPPRLAMRELVFNVTNAVRQIPLAPTVNICPMYDERLKRIHKLPCAARQTDVLPVGVGRGGVTVAHIPTGSYVQPADWDSVGLECDKMNPEAVTLHMDRFLGDLKRHLGDDLPAAGLGHVLLDSYEAGESNWTPRMREEFTARRGYDPLEFLPILGGYTNLYTAAEVGKFRADFDRTRKDLFRDVLFRIVSARLHAEGLVFANEPYYGPFEPEEVAPFVDRLMTEFWYDPKKPWGAGRHRVFNRFKGPGGRRHNVLEAEAFTGQPQSCMWDEMPATLKITCDEPWLDGINRFILHTCPSQPWGDDVKPGVTMGRWGTHFGRNQTWGEVGKPWFDYCARAQALLQWGEPAAERLAVSEPLKAFGRTDGARTLWFVANRADVETSFPFAGRWFDPVSGKVGAAPSVLAPRQSGFFERVAGAARSPRPVRRIVRELADFTPALGDRTKSSDREARYFSGTMTYRTTFAKPDEVGNLVVSLGEGANQVFVVRLNGRELGTVWCAPWETAIPSAALCEGENRLEIDVVNSWRNRLIGDEQEPADCDWRPGDYGGGSYLVAYPDWFKTGLKTRPSKGRRCFSTWNSFTADSPLVPSGLIGPVRIEGGGISE